MMRPVQNPALKIPAATAQPVFPAATGTINASRSATPPFIGSPRGAFPLTGRRTP